jgi:tetratricopeptide (TPR) repeat protein
MMDSDESSGDLYERGREAMERREFEQAAALFRRSIELDPHFKTLELLGQCLLESTPASSEAIVCLAASAGLGRRAFKSFYLLARALASRGDLTRAIEKLDVAIELHPQYKAAVEYRDELRKHLSDSGGVMDSSEVLNEIQDHQKVVEKIGYWPDFHDAEFIEIFLDRSKDEWRLGPTLTARIDVSDTTRQNPEHYVVAIKFFEVERLVLEEFNYQNAINGLEFEGETRSRNNQQFIKVIIHQGFGVGGSFKCKKIKVLSIEPYTPPSSYW